MVDKFSQQVLQKLTPNEDCKYYVYRLIDPGTNRTFYVGKGCGNRVFDHVNDYNNHFCGEDDIESLKIKTIKEIIGNNQNVNYVIHRWGLTEKEAFEVEAALIDCYPDLANIQSGYEAERGVITVEELEKICNLIEYTEPSEKYIIIKTTPNAIAAANGDLYEATRKAWRADLNRAKEYQYVLAVVYGVVQEVYKVKWSTTEDGRIMFEGEKTTNSEMKALVGKLLPAKYTKKGLANPFIYKK